MKHALFKSVMAVASFLISSNDVACAQPNAGNIALVEDSLAGTFCPVDAGTFVMGRTPIDVATKADEVPQHEVKIEKPFLIGQHEVTVDQFRLFCAQSGYVTEPEKLDGRSVGYRESTGDFELDRFSFRAPGFEQQGDHPVVCVTRRDANEYCRWLTSKSSDYIYSLPTEAEWEYACRAGSNTTWSGTDRVDDLAEFANLADSELRPNLSRAWQAQCHRWNDH